MMLPRISVEGRLAAEPNLRFSQAGTAVASLRVVTADRKRNEQTNEWVDGDTLWLDVTAFGKLAENLCESVVKGDLVIVSGKLRTEEWTDRESGQKRSKISLIADAAGPSLQFRQTPHSSQRGGRPAAQEGYQTPQEEPPF